MGKIPASMTGWSASHSARDPEGMVGSYKPKEGTFSHVCLWFWRPGTDGVHDRVSQHDVADVDSGDQTNKTGNNVRIVHIYGLRDGLKAKQQHFCVLGQGEQHGEMLGEAACFVCCPFIPCVFMCFAGLTRQTLPATLLTAGGPSAAFRACRTGY